MGSSGWRRYLLGSDNRDAGVFDFRDERTIPIVEVVRMECDGFDAGIKGIRDTPKRHHFRNWVAPKSSRYNTNIDIAIGSGFSRCL